jgi:hypothetical protein
MGTRFTETPEQVIRHVFNSILHIRSDVHFPTSNLCMNLHDNGMWSMQSLMTLGKDWWDTDLIYGGRTGGRFTEITVNDRIIMKNLIGYYNANIHFNGGEELGWIYVHEGMFNRFCILELPRLRIRYPYNSLLNPSAAPVVVHTPGPVGTGISPAARLHQEFLKMFQ